MSHLHQWVWVRGRGIVCGQCGETPPSSMYWAEAHL